MENPDSWSFAATGIWFSEQCRKKIELPEDDGGKTNVGISVRARPTITSLSRIARGTVLALRKPRLIKGLYRTLWLVNQRSEVQPGHGYHQPRSALRVDNSAIPK